MSGCRRCGRRVGVGVRGGCENRSFARFRVGEGGICVRLGEERGVEGSGLEGLVDRSRGGDLDTEQTGSVGYISWEELRFWVIEDNFIATL